MCCLSTTKTPSVGARTWKLVNKQRMNYINKAKQVSFQICLFRPVNFTWSRVLLFLFLQTKWNETKPNLNTRVLICTNIYIKVCHWSRRLTQSRINNITYYSWPINRAQLSSVHPRSFQTRKLKKEIWKAAHSNPSYFRAPTPRQPHGGARVLTRTNWSGWRCGGCVRPLQGRPAVEPAERRFLFSP